MGDVLTRDVPDDVIATLGARASRPRLSRSECLRLRLAQDAAATESPVSAGNDPRLASRVRENTPGHP